MEPLLPWMRYLLRFAGCYNLLVGVNLTVFYHEMFKTLGLPKPDLIMYVQLTGILVALFGVGYLLVASNPLENRNLLVLGFLSKLLGSIVGTGYVVLGKMPPVFMVILVFSDIIYLPFFWIIIRRVYRMVQKAEG
ncbi:MAG: hypothetical protein WD063_00040 [Pirellulales bacterium]